MNLLEDCILIWAGWVLFSFYLKQKQRFSVWSFTENASFISFNAGIWYVYSEMNKFEISKDLTFQKEQKQTEEIQVLMAISSKRRLFTSQDIHYSNSLSTEVQKG